MKQVMVMDGKAKNVFKYMALVSKYRGSETLKDLKESKKENKK